MLTARSRAICAWMTPGGEILCPPCAIEQEQASPLELARIEAGLAPDNGDSPEPLIAYNLDTHWGEVQWEQAQQARSEGDEARATELEESTEGYPCDRCGREIET